MDCYECTPSHIVVHPAQAYIARAIVNVEDDDDDDNEDDAEDAGCHSYLHEVVIVAYFPSLPSLLKTRSCLQFAFAVQDEYAAGDSAYA